MLESLCILSKLTALGLVTELYSYQSPSIFLIIFKSPQLHSSSYPVFMINLTKPKIKLNDVDFIIITEHSYCYSHPFRTPPLLNFLDLRSEIYRHLDIGF